MTMRRLLSPRVFAAAIAAVAVAAGAGSVLAEAARAASDCPIYSMSQPFLPWADDGYYFVGPGGAFESSLTGWTVKSAKIVSGNEPFYVHGSTDGNALSLPKGSTAKSPSICVSSDTPDLRVFVRNTGSATATLSVNMTYTSATGRASTVTVAKLSGGSSWTLSPTVLFLQNIQPLVDAYGQTWVNFTFASSGSFLVDDFYVDPIKHH
jgi:hypothetical protein